MSGAPSTSSLEVLKDLCVQGAFLRENVNNRHTNIHYKAQVRHMHSHSSTVGAHQHLNAPAKKCQHACEIISQTRPKNQYSPLDVFQADLCTRFVLIGLNPLSLQLTPLSLSYHQKVLLPWNTNLHKHLCTHIHARTNIHI